MPETTTAYFSIESFSKGIGGVFGALFITAVFVKRQLSSCCNEGLSVSLHCVFCVVCVSLASTQKMN